DRVRERAPRMEQFVRRKQMQQNLEHLADRLDGDRDKQSPHHTRDIDFPEPFEQFNVEIHFNHPYWEVIQADMKGPTFHNEYPDVNDYLNTYYNNADLMERLARALMEVAFPGVPDTGPNAPVQFNGSTVPVASASIDHVEEIQRYKKLLDQGVLTEEEFAAKKRQLLGL
ncbi:MAG: SHOCT domain-containing protein, partial [Oscillospiraceae bacterium]|nr:SHOCT domain-containing protein [Oscillospiraceae bacterium]